MHAKESGIEFLQTGDFAHSLWNFGIEMTPTHFFIINHVDLKSNRIVCVFFSKLFPAWNFPVNLFYFKTYLIVQMMCKFFNIFRVWKFSRNSSDYNIIVWRGCMRTRQQFWIVHAWWCFRNWWHFDFSLCLFCINAIKMLLNWLQSTQITDGG